jgi:hypothetical protein
MSNSGSRASRDGTASIAARIAIAMTWGRSRGATGRPFGTLVVEHLAKRFGDRVAFDGVSFEVGYGEVSGFLSPTARASPSLN